MRIVHISDLHFWHITLDPKRLAGKRFFGMGNLVFNRAWKYRMETMPLLIQHIRKLRPDHLLITGDLTATSLDEEFRAVRRALAPLDLRSDFVTVVPGNHDRYTHQAVRDRLFENYFGEYAPRRTYPWLKPIGQGTAVLGLDPCRPNGLAALGSISSLQIKRAVELLDRTNPPVRRLIVACHYPIALPAGIVNGRGHGLRGGHRLRKFLALRGPSLYCHGHIHARWAFTPPSLPRTICLDPGAAIKKGNRSGIYSSLLEIILRGNDVKVKSHVLRGLSWESETFMTAGDFFSDKSPRRTGKSAGS